MSAQFLVDVTRATMVESRHRGHVAVVGADGELIASAGDPAHTIFPRSAVKPLQAIGMLRCGLDFTDADLALAAASHSGEAFHIAGILRLLARSGLDEDDLQCPADWPYDEGVRQQSMASGAGMRRVSMNCSGKHAAMLRTCQINDWPTGSYLDPEHPLQQILRATIEDFTGDTIEGVTMDGCGAPLWSITVRGLARGLSRVIQAGPGTPESQVADAMRTFCEFSGGTNRDVTALMRGVPGLLAKDGAEAVQVMALPDGRGVALKIEDGGQRARPVAAAKMLAELGVDAEIVREQQHWPILGGGVAVGEVAPSRSFALRM